MNDDWRVMDPNRRGFSIGPYKIPPLSYRVDFTLSMFCLIWNLSSVHFYQFVFDLHIIFVLLNILLLELIKKFNMDIRVKMDMFQIKQNVLNLKSTLARTTLKRIEEGISPELDKKPYQKWPANRALKTRQ